MNREEYRRACYSEAWHRSAVPVPGWVWALHPKQRIVHDSPAKVKVNVAGRRGGKTTLGVSDLLEASRAEPDATALYLALTGKSAKSILWTELRKQDRLWDIGLKFNSTELTATKPGWGTIQLAGADDERKVERLRGLPYSIVEVDEAASFPDRTLRYLCEEVTGPGLADTDGALHLFGSPGATCQGYFYELATNTKDFPDVCRGHFTLLDNPKFAGRGQQVLTDVMLSRGWTEKTPAFMREYLGLWCRDPDWLVYTYERKLNLTESLPELKLAHVVAVDIGSSETKKSTCYTVLGYCEGHVFVVESFKRAGQTTSSMGEVLESLERKYNPVSMVLDAGGLGGAYVKELRSRLRTPLKAAEKTAKRAYIDLLNSDLRLGIVQILSQTCKELVGEIEILQWNYDRTEPDARFEDHACDSLLYGWRECKHYVQGGKPPEVVLSEDDRMMQAEDTRAKLPWWKRVT